MSFDHIFRQVKDYATRNAPAILTGLGVAGTISSVILAVQATPHALRDIYDHEVETGEKPTWKETIQLTWKHYVPTVAVTSISVASIIGAQSLNQRRQAALMSVYALTESAFRDYREKVIERVGPADEESLRGEIANDSIQQSSLGDGEGSSEVIIAGNGDHLCYDVYTGRYFHSDIETVRKAVNDINAQCLNQEYASLNEFYALLGLPGTEVGEKFGFRFDKLMDVHYSSHLTPENKPALAIQFLTAPLEKYYKIYR